MHSGVHVQNMTHVVVIFSKTSPKDYSDFTWIDGLPHGNTESVEVFKLGHDEVLALKSTKHVSD